MIFKHPSIWILPWAATFVGFVGITLNIRRIRWCFIVWMLSGFIWITYGMFTYQYALVVQSSAYLVLNIWGWTHWTKILKNNL